MTSIGFSLGVGVFALIWSLWLCRNDLVFKGKIRMSCRLSTIVLLCSVCGYLFQRSENRELFLEVCTQLERVGVARDIFT